DTPHVCEPVAQLVQVAAQQAGVRDKFVFKRHFLISRFERARPCNSGQRGLCAGQFFLKSGLLYLCVNRLKSRNNLANTHNLCLPVPQANPFYNHTRVSGISSQRFATSETRDSRRLVRGSIRLALLASLPAT